MILELLKEGKAKEAHELLSKEVKEGVQDYYNEYRKKDRTIRKTQVGNRSNYKDGSEPNKLPISVAKKIVNDAVAFLFGSPVNKIPNEESEASKELEDLWKSCRMDNMLMDFSEAVKSETEAAVIFYAKEKQDKTTVIKTRLITHENGVMYPSFDEYGDLIAFGWEFETLNEELEVVNKMIVFTEETDYYLTKGDEGWFIEDYKTNHFKKIPVVYLPQDEPEWYDVAELIDRLESSVSKLCDSNDYFFNPILIAIGAIKEAKDEQEQPLLTKDETARVFNAQVMETRNGSLKNADAKYLTWEQEPETVKMELESLKDFIYGLTSTPNLTIEAVKGIGQIANAGVTLMFLAPILKAKRSEGSYRVAITRMINVMIAGLINVTVSKNKAKLSELKYEIDFTSVLPDNIKETVETLIEATGGKPIMSQEAAVYKNPLVSDVKKDLDLLKVQEEGELIQDLGETAI